MQDGNFDFLRRFCVGSAGWLFLHSIGSDAGREGGSLKKAVINHLNGADLGIRDVFQCILDGLEGLGTMAL